MKTEITSEDRGMYRVSTSHGTYYVVDMTNMLGKRIPAEGRGRLVADNQWFGIRGIACEVGSPMRLECIGLGPEDWYTWRLSTNVVSIEPHQEPATS